MTPLFYFAINFKEKFWRWLAWKLPRPLVYWAYIRLHAYATCTGIGATKHPDETTWNDALKAWESK